MTTENVAILFTDVVGSTELSQRLSAEDADEARRGHFSILRQAIAEAGGTEVKNLGDGLMVVFGSASAALACGVAMQQGVERDNRDRKHSVGLRVGLSGGEVSREDGDYFGDPVVEAARLCATCETGQVLAADVVKAVAGRRNRHECRSIGELTLKGLPYPVETVEVLWEPLGRADTGISIALPSRLAGRPSVGMVGRETEMQTMVDAAKRVAGGEGREVFLISGEAGLGKTTLVAEAARTAFDTGACVLFGHCEEDLATPYQLFSEAIGHYVTHAPEDELDAHVREHGSELSRLVPALASRIPDLPPSKASDSDTERFLLFAAIVSLLARVSEQQPVVLVLDDLQWADKGSLLLLRHLMAAEQAMRVLILGTYRDSELSRSHPLLDTLAALHRQTGVSRIELAGLDDIGVMAFMEAAAGHTLDDAGVRLAHAVYRETDGNPFFVSEVLRHLSETGAIYQNATGRWVGEESLEQMALPDSVRMVIGARVGRLGQDAERVLSMAAVIGRDFDVDLLARATKTSEDELLDILEAAASAALVREPPDVSGLYTFAHALIQHTLYEDLGPNRRARAHRQVAEALEDLCSNRPGSRVGELALHWFSATQPVDLTKAIDYSRQAGDAALSALAPADALRYYAQALDLYRQTIDPDPVLGIDLSIGLGTAQRQTGAPAFRETLLAAAQRAADLGDTKRLVVAALANNRGYFSATGSVDTERIAVLEAACDALAGTESAEQARLLALLALELTWGGNLPRRKNLADQALAIARTLGDPVTLVGVINSLLYAINVPETLAERLLLSAEGFEAAQIVDDPILQFFCAQNRSHTLYQASELAEADGAISVARGIAERLGQPTLLWLVTTDESTRATLAGALNEGEKLAIEAAEIGSATGEPDTAALFATQIGVIRMMQGRTEEIVELARQMIAENPELTAFSTFLAHVYCDLDGPDDARAILEPFVADGFASLPQDPTWLIAMGSVSYAVAELGWVDAAEKLLELLRPFCDQVPYTLAAAFPEMSYSLGLLTATLGCYGEAEAYFSRAAETHERIGAAWCLVMTLLAWGRFLIARDDPKDLERGSALLKQALHSARDQGYGLVERRALQVLQSLGSS